MDFPLPSNPSIIGPRLGGAAVARAGRHRGAGAGAHGDHGAAAGDRGACGLFGSGDFDCRVSPGREKVVARPARKCNILWLGRTQEKKMEKSEIKC